MVHNNKEFETDLREARSLLNLGNQDKARQIFSRLATKLSNQSATSILQESRPGNDIYNTFAVTVFNPPKMPMLDILREVAESICFGLRAIGLDAIITTDMQATPRRRIFLGAGCLPNAKKLGVLAPLPALRDDTILYQLEQIINPEHFLMSKLLPWFMKFPSWEYSHYNLDSLNLLGLKNIRYVPLGYVPEWTRIPERSQDIDVLLYGSLSKRRKHILDELHAKGVKVVYLVNCYGEERDAYIARARIVINIHYYDAKIFEYPRVLYLLANKKFVVSETGNDTDELEFSSGVEFAEYDNLVDTCLRFLDSPTSRDKISEEGYRLISQKPMSAILQSVVSNDD